VQEQENQKI